LTHETSCNDNMGVRNFVWKVLLLVKFAVFLVSGSKQLIQYWLHRNTLKHLLIHLMK